MIKKMWGRQCNLNTINKGILVKMDLNHHKGYHHDVPIFITDEDPFENVRKLWEDNLTSHLLHIAEDYRGTNISDILMALILDIKHFDKGVK